MPKPSPAAPRVHDVTPSTAAASAPPSASALPVWECAEAIAAETLSALPPTVVAAAAGAANVFRSGTLSPRQADVVAHTMPPAQQSQAVAFARSVTLRGVEDEHGTAWTTAGTVTFAAPPEAAIVFRLALDAVRVHLAAQSAVRPQASDALLFELGVRASGRPLLRAGVGDVLLGA